MHANLNAPTARRRLWADGVAALLGHDVHPAIQFVKYALVGGLATAVHIVIFFLCGWRLLPCLTSDDIVVRLLGLSVPAVSEGARAWNAGFCNGIAFLFSNLFCYLLNRLFVFKPGRHPWALELLFFLAVSAVSLIIGTTVQTFLISHQGVQTTIAFGANLVSSLLINYAMRKFVIFKG